MLKSYLQLREESVRNPSSQDCEFNIDELIKEGVLPPQPTSLPLEIILLCNQWNILLTLWFQQLTKGRLWVDKEQTISSSEKVELFMGPILTLENEIHTMNSVGLKVSQELTRLVKSSRTSKDLVIHVDYHSVHFDDLIDAIELLLSVNMDFLHAPVSVRVQHEWHKEIVMENSLGSDHMRSQLNVTFVDT